MIDNPTLPNIVDAVDEVSEPTRKVMAAAFESLSDEQLGDAYGATGRKAGGPIADLLAVAAEDAA